MKLFIATLVLALTATAQADVTCSIGAAAFEKLSAQTQTFENESVTARADQIGNLTRLQVIDKTTGYKLTTNGDVTLQPLNLVVYRPDNTVVALICVSK